MNRVIGPVPPPEHLVSSRPPSRRKLARAAVLAGLMLVTSACSASPSVNEAARDRCEAKWGVGNCVERSDKWVPLAIATTVTTVTVASTTTTATTTTAARPTSSTTTTPPAPSLDPYNMTYPAGSCGEDTPPIPVSNGESGPGVLSDGPYNGVYVEEVLDQRDFDGSGTDDLEVHLTCDFGGNALAIFDYTVIVSEIDGQVVLLSAREVE